MTKLHDFTMEEMMIFSISVLGALGTCTALILKQLFRSKCKTINCLCFKCIRDTDLVYKEEKLELGKTESKEKINENKEPEAEPEP